MILRYSLFYLLCVCSISGYGQCCSKLEKLEKLYDESETARTDLLGRVGEYARKTRELENTVSLLNDWIYRNNNFIPSLDPLVREGNTSNDKEDTPDDSGDNGSTENGKTESDNTEEIERYRAIIAALRIRLRAVQDELDSLKTAHEAEIAAQADRHLREATRLGNDLILLNADLNEKQKILDCVASAVTRAETMKAEAQPALNEARKAFAKYGSLDKNNPRNDEEIRLLLDKIFNTYNDYSGEPISATCGGMTINDFVDYLDATDHLNLARILAKDPRHLVNHPKYGTVTGKQPKTDIRAAGLNADLIYHVSQIYEKQNDFSKRAETNQLVSTELMELLNVLPAALLSSQNINTSDTVRQTSFVLGAYKNIPKDFEDKRYVRAIGTYNRFQRLEEEEGLKDEVLLRAQTRMAIGAIMVFDLGEVSSLYDVSLKGTWLRGQMLGLQENGAKLLRKVIQMPQTGKLNTKEYTDLFDARHEAAYLLSKRYEPENKTERENRKQKRRTKRKRRGRKS